VKSIEELAKKFFDGNYYDAAVIEQLFKSHHFWGRYSWYYRSNWRVLHIDGMEGYVFSPNLPTAQGNSIKFFQYEPRVYDSSSQD
jgi:hypothetical protein